MGCYNNTDNIVRFNKTVFMKKFIAIVLLSISFQGKAQSCLQLDIMIVADLSASVQGNEQFIQQAMYSFVEQFELSEEGIKIGVLTFNESPTVLSLLSDDKASVLYSIKQMQSGSSTTNMTDAFFVAINELLSERGRRGFRKLIVIISDGIPDQPSEVKLISRQIQQANITVCGVLIEEGLNMKGDEFMNEVSSPDYYVKSDYKSLGDQIKKLDICL